MQDEITERIVTALDVYRGIHEFMKGQKEANAAARGNFEQVARLVPESSIGPALAAFGHWRDAFRGWTTSRSLDLAEQWAERAMPIQDADGQAHTVMAHIAPDRIRQAIRLTPIHAPWIKVVLAASCKELRQWDDASTAAKEALRKKSDDIDARLVLIEVATGDADAARDLVQEVSKLKPEFSVAKWAETQPYKDLAVLERITANLRSAGLPS